MSAFYWNLAGSIVAIVANLYSFHVGDARMAPARAAVASIAAFYSVGYLWVISTGNDIAWSRFFRWVSIPVWIIVWCLPAVLGARTNQRTKRALTEVLGSDEP